MPHLPIPHTSRSPQTPPPKHRLRPTEPSPQQASILLSAQDSALLRTMPLRCVILTVLSMAAGYLILTACMPAMGGRSLSAILSRHFAADAPTGPVWLRLLGARLPILFLAAIAGLTRFSGGLTSALLIYRGICDGGALCVMLALVRGRITHPPTALPLWGLLLAFLLWMLTDAALRLIVTVSSRRLAALCATVGDSSATAVSSDARAALRYHLWRHTAVSLGGACGLMAACLIYASVIL